MKASWPLSEDYCKGALILHWKNWRNLSDIRHEEETWVSKFNDFLQSEMCPNFVKAEIERAKNQNYIVENVDSSVNEDHDIEQPEWMDLVRPDAVDGSS